MMKSHLYRKFGRRRRELLKYTILFMVSTILVLLSNCSGEAGNVTDTGDFAEIFPEYYNLVIPPNIAPLNFIVKEPGKKYRVELTGSSTGRIVIRQRSSHIKIPLKKWHHLLAENAGGTIDIDIRTRQAKKWNKFTTIQHTIASDPIDDHLVYRLVHAVYLKWNKMGIYQRNLTNFRESALIENNATDHGCMNCHVFANRDPSKLMMHFRIVHSGTLIWDEGKLTKVNTKTRQTMSAGIYPAWHPDGKHIAMTTGRLNPHLTTSLDNPVEVADRASDLIIYDVEKNTVTSSPKVSTDRRENLPLWAPDGKYLYYLSAPAAVEGDDESLLHARYSLMRITYNTGQNTWGEPEMILDADSIGMSISMPSISPNGRYLVCAMTDFGYFTIFHRESDLYMVDLESMAYRKLDLNSPEAESYSAWSSNGRWLVFSSKRTDGVYTRPFIAYMDKSGHAHTPFLLPQKNPGMYEQLLANYNRPELVTGKVNLSPLEIRNAIVKEPQNAKFKN